MCSILVRATDSHHREYRICGEPEVSTGSTTGVRLARLHHHRPKATATRLAGCPHDLDRHTCHRRPRAGRARARDHDGRSAAAPAAGVGAGAGRGRAARDGGGAALGRTAGVPHPGHGDRARRAADQDGLRGGSPSPGRRVRRAGGRPPGRAGDGRRRQGAERRHGTRFRGHHAGSGRHAAFRRAVPGRQGRRDLAAAQRDHRAGRPAHRRPGRDLPPTAVDGSGSTTAARSATDPTPRARRPRGRRWRRRSAASSWSTWGSPAVRCSTRAPHGRCETPRPTW